MLFKEVCQKRCLVYLCWIKPRLKAYPHDSFNFLLVWPRCTDKPKNYNTLPVKVLKAFVHANVKGKNYTRNR